MTPDRAVVSWNPGAERLFGFSEQEVLGRPADFLAPADHAGELDEVIPRLDAGDRAGHFDGWRRRRDGSLVEVTVTVSAIRDPDGSLIGYSMVMSDLTERRRVEEDLAAARASREVFADRDRIARDLHDLVIQRLFAAGMALQGVVSADVRRDVAERVIEVVDDLDSTIAEIRSTIFALGQGPQLAGSVRAQLIRVASMAAGVLGFQPRVHFDGAVDSALPGRIAEHVVAVTREALSNVARHARAASCDVTLRVGDQVTLEVVDDGRGIGEVTRTSGLANLADRARGLGGSFTVEGDPGKGTRLEWRVPAQH